MVKILRKKLEIKNYSRYAQVSRWLLDQGHFLKNSEDITIGEI